MKVLVACEFSGTVGLAFQEAGHDVLTCDLLPTEQPGVPHYEGDVVDILFEDYDLLIAHPPCTALTNAGVRWLYKDGVKANGKDPARWRMMRRAADFFHTFLDRADHIPLRCVENPVPHGHAGLPPFTQSFQPWEFGHGEIKRTCLWLRNLPPLKATEIVEGRTPRVHYMPPGPNRQKERSRFFRGVALAMADQWGDL
jgi:hypothetical protein